MMSQPLDTLPVQGAVPLDDSHACETRRVCPGRRGRDRIISVRD